MENEKPLEAASRAAAQELTRQLYADVKSWLPSLWRWLKRQHHGATMETYSSPATVLEALRRGLLSDGDFVTIECKPAPFGPFLRSHFLSVVIGNHTRMRLGPPLSATNPVLGLMAQITSQLSPVGLFPVLEEDVSQACLYPSDATTCGFIGLLPGVDNLVTYLPALLATRHTPFCNMPCHLSGEMRLITPAALLDAGFQAEVYEELRQSGDVWALDATVDDSRCVPLDDAISTELWGGLYASGHLEIASGKIEVTKLVDALRNAMSSSGYEVRVHQNLAGRKEIVLFARGFRACLDSAALYFSLHMDADLALDFKTARSTFDRVCQNVLLNVKSLCEEASVDLRNPCDLDFTYSNAATAFTVMESLGAHAIRNPLIIAIRDWHKKRVAR
jgi:hypothetical protein